MHWQYVIPGYIVAAMTLGCFAITTLRRGRALSKRVPEGQRRFLDP